MGVGPTISLSSHKQTMIEVCDAYERKVRMSLDMSLPEHSPECDEGFTQRLCLRCDVLAAMSVTLGMTRPLIAVQGTFPGG